jgi:Zn-dependent peptidase ImmA (M78 family)/transcriptional regulator with XRE-family HTH domain
MTNLRGALNPEMLLTARNYNGWSQTDVAEKCKISQGLYSKVESGATAIGSEDDLVGTFSEVLGFPKPFFFKNARALGMPTSFHEMYRKPKSVSGKKVLAKVSADLTIRMLSVSTMLDSIELDPQLKLPQYDAEDHGHDGAATARMVRRTWMIPNGPISNLTALVEKAGIIVFPTYFSAPKVDGVSVNISGMPPVIFLNSISPADRTRFSLAHELGHVVMHRQASQTMEAEANAFASELLMPDNEMRAEFSRKIDLAELARLKRIRKVSMAALLYKAGSMGKLTPNQSAYLWRQMARYRSEEPETTQFEKEKPTTLASIVNIFISKLGYSTEDFAKAFDLWEDKARTVLENILPAERPKLRLVVS